MKVYVICILALCCPAAFGMLSASVDNTLYGYVDACIKDTGAIESDIQQARKSFRIPDDGKLDYFATCMLKHYNVINSDGSVNPNSVGYRIISDNVGIYGIADRCKTKTGSNPYETSRKIMNCFLEAGEVMLPLLPRRS